MLVGKQGQAVHKNIGEAEVLREDNRREVRISGSVVGGEDLLDFIDVRDDRGREL